MIVYTTGRIVRLEAVLLLLPAAVAALYGEACVYSLLLTAAVAAVLGVGLTLPFRPKTTVIYAPEGFVITALAWILLSAVGALPFVFSGEIPSYIDAFFETVSGFTTTGASILTDIEAMSRGLLFWRSFTHWIGGMGILVMMMAIFPSASGRTIHIMRAEMPGPAVEKFTPRIHATAKLLYLIYIVLTVLETVFLLAGGMPLYDSLVHAMGTAGTGGFGIKADSLAGYSPYLQWVVTVFMLLFGVNFNVYYLLLLRRFRSIAKSGETWCYLAVFAVSTALIALNIRTLYSGFGETLRHAAFQVATILTTTGFATADFNLWPGFSRALLVLLMFFGGCAGSTAGGLKISRVMLLFKMIRRNLRSALHPRAVGTVRLDGKTVEESTLQATGNYFALYVLCLAAIILALCLEPFSLETNFTAAVACFNNIGPGLGDVGPAGGYAAYSPFSKLLLSLAMLMGRLELFPILIAFSPATYLQNRQIRS